MNIFSFRANDKKKQRAKPGKTFGTGKTKQKPGKPGSDKRKPQPGKAFGKPAGPKPKGQKRYKKRR